MNLFEVTIRKGPRSPHNQQTLVYYPSVTLRPRSPGVSSSETVGYPTQDDAIDSIERRLQQNVDAGDHVRYKGLDYQAVVDVVDTITKDKPNWA
jgi:hypothetical protein